MSKIASLSDSILAAGVQPGFTIRELAGPTYEIIFAPGTPQGQQDTANAIIASFDASDGAQATRDLQTIRDTAKAAISLLDVMPEALRSLVILLLSEINTLRQRDRDRAVDVAAATSLANLQTRWAARPPLNDRTAQQAKAALLANIDSGQADPL